MVSNPSSPTPRLVVNEEPKPREQPRPQAMPDKTMKASGDDFGHFTSSTLQVSLWKQYQSGKYTDLTVTCGDRSFQVHKVVVCAQSSFFDAACGGRFKESTENKIHLSDEHPDMVERLFQFLYLGNYTDGEYFDELPSIPALMDPEDVEAHVKEASGPVMYPKFDDSSNDPEFDPDQGLYAEDGENAGDDGEQDEDDLEHDEHDSEPLEYDSEQSSDSPDTEPNGSWPPDQYPLQLFTSLRMYVIGDKYNIPALQLLAKKRFTRTAETHWKTSKDFPAVLDELFMTTAPTDPLRLYVCTLIIWDYIHDISVTEKIVPIAAKHPDLSLKLLDATVALMAK